MTYKLGSLFDGSGGFPLAGFLCDIEPVWAAEIEPYPIAVTRTRFPMMKHYGDISKINGAEIEPVDIISFGSPCQDLSVAGKRAGLKHEDNGDEETTRSGLFMEAVRIIKEMRRATNGKYPTFALWENVPGAFSSNKGEDFRIVLEELIKIVEPGASMPSVPKKGWSYSDSYIGDGWSLAYRVFDAQYWGVPQRRRRIYLVLDLGGERAREVLFEREGLRGYFAEGRTPWEGTSSHAEGSIGAAGSEGEVPYTLKIRSGCEGGGKGALIQTDQSATLATNNDQYLFQPVYALDHAITTGGNCTAQGPCVYEDMQGTLKACGPHAVAYGVVSKGNGEAWCIEEKHMALSTGGGQAGQGFPCTMQPIADEYILDDQGGQQISVRTDGKTPTLRAEMHGNVPCVMEVAGIDGYNAALTGDMAATLGVNCGASTGRNGVLVAEKTCTFEPGAASRLGGYVWEDIAGTLRATPGDNQLSVCVKKQYLFENHSQDTRYKGPLNVCPMLPAQLGTGGNNTPFVVEKEPICCIDGDKIGKAERAGGSGLGIRPGDKMYTLTAKDVHGVCLPINDKATRYKGGGETRNEDGSGNGFGVGLDGDPSPTLTAGDRHAVAFESYQKVTGPLMANSHPGSYTGQDAFSDMLVAGVDCRNMNESPEIYPTLQTKPNGGQSLNFSGAVRVQYIVRRLTPTECARLQGFADRWGDVDQKDDFTDAEYNFWLNVRNTHAEINGKATKDYTKEQMLAWYKKLQSDSAEYKMWGNGISLPTALYCMQGITDALKSKEEK